MQGLFICNFFIKREQRRLTCLPNFVSTISATRFSTYIIVASNGKMKVMKEHCSILQFKKIPYAHKVFFFQCYPDYRSFTSNTLSNDYIIHCNFIHRNYSIYTRITEKRLFKNSNIQTKAYPFQPIV